MNRSTSPIHLFGGKNAVRIIPGPAECMPKHSKVLNMLNAPRSTCDQKFKAGIFIDDLGYIESISWIFGDDDNGLAFGSFEQERRERETDFFPRFGSGHCNGFGNNGGESSRQKRGCYNYGEEGHFIGECPKPKENKAFVERAWSDSEDGDEPQNDATCLMAIDSQEVIPKPSISNNVLDIINLQKENEELLSNDLEFEVKKFTKSKEVVELCQKCDVLTQIIDSLKSNVSKLQDEALNFSKFKKSSVVLDDILSR
ncbi:kinase-like domain, phloem protein 2-like protein [Tanacetum coccineum]